MSAPCHSPPRLARVDEFDGLRGVLALWVALAHILAWTGHWENPLPGRLARAWEVVVSASPAVETFIILSGFAISFLLYHKRQSYGIFMRGRFFRIYPVYLVCLAFGIGTSFLVPGILEAARWNDTIYFEWVGTLSHNEASAFGSHVFWHLTLLNGVLTRDYLPGAAGTFLTPAWSITLEWQYYLVAPLLARGTRSAIGLLVIGLVAWLGIRYAGLWENPILSFLPPRLPLFLIGIASYHFYAGLSDSKGFRHLPSVMLAGALVVAVVANWHVVAVTIWILAFGCVLVRGRDPLARLLGLVRLLLLHPVFQHLGRISYPVYLVHWPVIILILTVMLRLWPDMSQTAAFVVLTAVGLPAILILAELLHRVVEKPAIQYGRKLDRK